VKPEICIKKIWSSDDLIEIQIYVCDGNALFFNSMYVREEKLLDLVNSLNSFKSRHGGYVMDILLGAFGKEFELGAFFARLHILKTGFLYIETHQQSEYFVFKEHLEASEAKMYLKVDPSRLDAFIDELAGLATGINSHATLIGLHYRVL
jgi:hypothetical protein